MRRPFDDQGQLFSYISPEQRVPAQHPLRTIRELVRKVFRDLDHDFRILYFTTGHPSIPPEQLLSALLLQMFCGVRSERQLMEQLDYNLLYRWFVGLASDDAVCRGDRGVRKRETLPIRYRESTPSQNTNASLSQNTETPVRKEGFSVDC